MFDDLYKMVATRYVFSIILGGIIGSGIIGVLSEFAAYNFSLFHGVRPPVEGIPYLKATVSVLSIIIFISTTSIFYLIFFILKYISEKIYIMLINLIYSNTIDYPFLRFITKKYKARVGDFILRKTKKIGWEISEEISDVISGNREKSANSFRNFFQNLPLLTIIKIIISILIFIFIISGFSFYIKNQNIFNILIFYALVLVFIPVIVFIMWNPKLFFPISIILTILYFIAVPASLFYAPLYGSMLRFLGYGGGIPVTVDFDGQEDFTFKNASWYLFLRTSENFIFFDSNNNQIIEIPSGRIIGVSYHFYEKRNRIWNLPK